jgi:hypothetical protein
MLAAKSSAFSCVIGFLRPGRCNAIIFLKCDDFQRGINKAVANNWITIDLRNRYRYQLTTTGYAVGRMIHPVVEA